MKERQFDSRKASVSTEDSRIYPARTDVQNIIELPVASLMQSEKLINKTKQNQGNVTSHEEVINQNTIEASASAEIKSSNHEPEGKADEVPYQENWDLNTESIPNLLAQLFEEPEVDEDTLSSSFPRKPSQDSGTLWFHIPY